MPQTSASSADSTMPRRNRPKASIPGTTSNALPRSGRLVLDPAWSLLPLLPRPRNESLKIIASETLCGIITV